MKRLWKALFGAALLIAAITSTPAAYGVNPYCAQCVDAYDCMACCLCGGHNMDYCAPLCY